MSHILRRATAIVMLAFAATHVAHARVINDQHHHFRPGYAGTVYSQAPRELWPWNVPGRGVATVGPQLNNPRLQIKGYGLPRPPGLWPVQPALLLTHPRSDNQATDQAIVESGHSSLPRSGNAVDQLSPLMGARQMQPRRTRRYAEAGRLRPLC
jgi:hypothetical protein